MNKVFFLDVDGELNRLAIFSIVPALQLLLIFLVIPRGRDAAGLKSACPTSVETGIAFFLHPLNHLHSALENHIRRVMDIGSILPM